MRESPQKVARPGAAPVAATGNRADGLPARPKPFVKWAGGKRQLIGVLDNLLPGKFGTYYEPFVGGGALLLHILVRRLGQRCCISDLNGDLVLAYEVIRDRIDDLISSLREHEASYLNKRDGSSGHDGDGDGDGDGGASDGSSQKNTRYYYSVRQDSPQGDVERASRLIFLNRTCFNGLYRVNSQGQFNVPPGRYARPNIVNEANLRLVSDLLRSSPVSIGCRDFEAAVDGAGRDDLVYLDPPYHPVSSTSNFTSYTNNAFSRDDLDRLASLCHELDSRGCKVLLSNSDSDEVRALFPEGRWQTRRIRANRTINSDSGKRKGHFELLIKNYGWQWARGTPR